MSAYEIRLVYSVFTQSLHGDTYRLVVKKREDGFRIDTFGFFDTVHVQKGLYVVVRKTQCGSDIKIMQTLLVKKYISRSAQIRTCGYQAGKHRYAKDSDYYHGEETFAFL